MLLNKEVSAVQAYSANIKRSMFNMPSGHTTTFSPFELVPIFVQDCLPAGTYSLKMSAMVRMLTPIYPVADTAFCDVFFFSVPKRLLWTHWTDFRGENLNTYWTPTVEYQIPQITAPSDGWDVGSVADHFGIPPKITGFSVDAMPMRAYALIWNEWFRSSSITQPVSFTTGDETVNGSNKGWSDYITDGSLGGKPLRVARLGDLFSRALLAPQAGAPVEIPLDGRYRVYAATDAAINGTKYLNDVAYGASPIVWDRKISNSGKWTTLPASDKRAVLASSTAPTTERGNTASTGSGDALTPINLVADLGSPVRSDSYASITIDSLRQAFAVQNVLEAINGNGRYTEILRSAFGVTSPDARMQRPELIGTKRFALTVNEINQTSSTDSTSPLGQPGAVSKTLMMDDVFSVSLTEDCYIIGLACVRNVNTYSQGLERFWTKKTRFEYFYPQMDSIGESYIKNSELFLQNNSVVDDDGRIVNDLPFGYQEPWYEYKHKNSINTGLMRGYVNQNLSAWNYGDNYSELPTLSTDWLYPDGSNIMRTLAVQNQPAFIADFYFDETCVLPMSVVPDLGRMF